MPYNAGPPADWTAYRRYPYLLAKLLFFVALAALGWLVLKQAKGVLSMLFISLLAAYVLDPVVDWFEARGIHRATAILILVVCAVVFFAIFVMWMVPTLVSEFAQIGGRLQHFFSQDPATLIQWAKDNLGLDLGQDTMADLKAKTQEYAPQVIGTVGAFLQTALTRSMGLVGWLLNMVMVPIFIFYFLRDWDHMVGWVRDHLPRDHKASIVARAGRVDTVVGDWLRGQVQVALILAALYATGLALVGIKLAIPIGILAGLLNVVPYLGFAFGFGLAILMCLLEWAGFGPIIGVGSVFLVAQVLEGYVLTPRIVGEKVGLSPVTVIIVLLLGGELLGLLGFLLAVPTAGAVKTILNEILDWYRHSEAYLGPAPAAAAPAEPAPADPAQI